MCGFYFRGIRKLFPCTLNGSVRIPSGFFFPLHFTNIEEYGAQKSNNTDTYNCSGINDNGIHRIDLCFICSIIISNWLHYSFCESKKRKKKQATLWPICFVLLIFGSFSSLEPFIMVLCLVRGCDGWHIWYRLYS